MAFVWFWRGFCCKGSTKDEQSLHVNVQKSRTTFHNVCLFACCQLGLSIRLESIAEPVLANTGSGKLWLVQKLKVCKSKHPQGFRESPRREGTGSHGRMAGKAFGGPFSQKVARCRSHEPPLAQNVAKRYQNMLTRVPHGTLS